jgi:hypothetical protein
LQRESGKKKREGGSQAWNRAWGRRNGREERVLRRVMCEDVCREECSDFFFFLLVGSVWRYYTLWNGDVLVWEESEGTTHQHTSREVSHDRFGLNMEVAEHFIAAPAAQEADNVRVNMRAE